MSDPVEGSKSSGVETRRLAIEAVERILESGAYANLLLPGLLDRSELERRDKAFVTELVYSTTRRRRALDFLVDRYIARDDVEPRVRAALQVGAEQIVFLRTPAHAAVDSTVAATPKRARGFVNAVLRKLAGEHETGDIEWPTEAIRLSYPDWLFDLLGEELGERHIAVLEAMNEPARAHIRPDGYRQDPASQAVGDLVGADVTDRVIDLCAAPGGKATHLAGSGATVVGMDLHRHRADLIVKAAADTGTEVSTVVADGVAPPVRPGSASIVLVDAPCSGLGSLRRRADARWRIRPGDIGRLADLQFELVAAAADLCEPGGRIVFSTCTLTNAESIDVDARIADEIPELEPEPLPAPWEQHGRGGRLLPDTFAGDGMSAFSYRVRDR